MKKILLITLVIIVVGVVGYYTFTPNNSLPADTDTTSPTTTVIPPVSNTEEVSYENIQITENRKDCAFDGDCTIILENGQKIVYAGGLLPPDAMEEFNRCIPKTDLSELEPGDSLALSGTLNENNEITFCEEDHYVTIL